MTCAMEYAAVVAAGAGVASAGIIAVVGAPTGALTAAGAVGAVAALGAMALELAELAKCYRRHGQEDNAARTEKRLAQAERELERLKGLLGLI